MNISLRPESPADEGFLRQMIWQTISEELGANAWPQPMRDQLLGMQYSARRQAALTQLPNAASNIIEEDGNPCGWLVVATMSQEVRLVELMVTARRRNSRIGTTVIQQILADAATSAIAVRLHVNVSNQAAVRLYARLGFRRIDGNEVQQLMECQPR